MVSRESNNLQLSEILFSLPSIIMFIAALYIHVRVTTAIVMKNMVQKNIKQVAFMIMTRCRHNRCKSPSIGMRYFVEWNV